MAAEVIQVPVRGGAEPQPGAAGSAHQFHRVPADLHTVIMAAAAAGDAVGPGGDVLKLREKFVHNDIVGECLRLAAV